jgi:hypothetical protein
MSFRIIDVLHRGRERKPNPQLQERIAAYTLRAAWDVKATPVKAPVKEQRNG